MLDVVDKRTRSRIMSKIRSKDTKPELELAELLAGLKVKYKRNDTSLPGFPDFVIKKFRLIVFIHGCFWHGCFWHYKEPKSNVAYWRSKMIRNRGQDIKVRSRLNKAGWSVMAIWEHALVDLDKLKKRIRKRLEKQKKLASLEGR